MADVDVSAIFSPYEMRSIRKHLAAVLGQHEKDAVVIPKDEFFRFLAGGDGSTSSLYANRLYAIFDMEKKGHVRRYVRERERGWWLGCVSICYVCGECEGGLIGCLTVVVDVLYTCILCVAVGNF